MFQSKNCFSLIFLVAVSALFFIAAAAATTAVQAHESFPKASDVLLTSRSVHSKPIGNPDTHPLLNTTEAIAAFHANRLEWVYTVSEPFLQSMVKSNIAVGAAINANVPDNISGKATFKIGRILNLTLHPITAPWMAEFGDKPYYGCINNPDYLAILHSRALTILKRGATSLQHDDPHSNYEAVKWKNGGCYCKFCMKGFAKFAASRGLVPSGKNESSFDYREYLISKGGYNHGSTKLRVAFEQFQFDSVVTYQKNLRAFLEKEMYPSKVTTSCNNGNGLWDNITLNFDYGLGELSAGAATPEHLRLSFLTHSSGGLLPEGKLQVFTMPKVRPPVKIDDKFLTRKSFGLAKALDGHMLVPWDIYLPSPKALRFYGNVSDFVDQFQIVRSNAGAFAAFSKSLLHTWKAAGIVQLRPALSNIYWTIRGSEESSKKNQIQLHLVDWSWPRDKSSSSPYPLPKNKGEKVCVFIDLSKIQNKNEFMKIQGVKNPSASWLSPNGPKTISASIINPGNMLKICLTSEMMNPWCVFDVSF